MSPAPPAAPPSATRAACLGPDGSFSHLIAEMRFPGLPVETLSSIAEVFDRAQADPHTVGIVPIENSSGGFIIDTVDRLIADGGNLYIQEELTLDVKLALLGHADPTVEVIYSHSMPFFHADEWLRQHYPTARRVAKPSTAVAAQLAAAEPGAAAIGPRQNARRHGLEVLHYPIAGEVPNMTQFFVISHQPPTPDATQNRSAWVVDLADRPGSLCLFLTPLSQRGINLKRLESRPIRGQPNQYRFYIEIEGSQAQSNVQAALDQARSDGASLRCLGAYTSGLTFVS
ncbi:MAG: prephenate dehydratase [Verrucomicrobiales bacterium]|nr:prephenate dehydratase [Verrucomicrobiales bacterium]